jgi:predicted adenylyl cyclase CyaB
MLSVVAGGEKSKKHGELPVNRNIELKARHPDLDGAREAARSLGAVAGGILEQTDTYFHVSRGRLKLRQFGSGAMAELIWYSRENSIAFRASDYIVTPIPDAPTALAALTAALSVRGVVRKRRELWMLANIRIHLDQVRDLGNFVEFEAVMGPADDEGEARDALRSLCEAMRILESDRVAVSYSDLAGI